MLNYLLGTVHPIIVSHTFLTFNAVWGPEPIRLGFIGAPIATSVSTILITISYVIYGVSIAPKTAWHPWTMKAFEDLGALVKLGLSGVAQLAEDVRTHSQSSEIVCID